MKKNAAYLLAAILMGTIVYVIMHWLFHFGNEGSIMYGFIAATVEAMISLGKSFFVKIKKGGSA
ncbi:MAG: hypothetical protein ABIS69_11230 [Sediminibacterium sp.]